MTKYIIILIITFLLVILTQAIFSSFNILLPLNLFLVLLVFITMIFGFNWGFVMSIFIGLCLNLFSALPFGTIIIIYLIVVTVVSFLYKNVFINLSLYTSLLLTFLATLLYQFLILLFNFILYLINLTSIYIIFDRMFWLNLAQQVIFNLIVMTVIFILAKATSQRLNLAFLVKK